MLPFLFIFRQTSENPRVNDAVVLWLEYLAVVQKVGGGGLEPHSDQDRKTPNVHPAINRHLASVSNSKTAITLTPPTVGRQSVNLSADKMPDFSSFFIGRQKK